MTRRIYVSPRSEDRELTSYDRVALTSQARELGRNFALFDHAVRQHLNFVARFSFSAVSPDEDQNNRVERAFHEWANDPERCDYEKRHDFATLLRLIETHRLRDGDVGVLRVDDYDGPSLQLILGDRIRDDSVGESLDPTMRRGVKLGARGENVAYKVYRRTRDESSYEFETWIPADQMDLVGYFDSYDQARGVSPLPSGLREFWHLYECYDAALIKMKHEQSVGLVFKRDKSSDGFGTPEQRAEQRANEFDARKAVEQYGAGTILFDLDKDEDASFMSDGTPSQNFQAFVRETTRLALASLDVPYSFYDGSSTNFYGSKGELNHFIERARAKQRGLFPMLNKTTRWLLATFVRDGILPPEDGNVLFRWTGAVMPLWTLVSEAKDWQIATMNGYVDQRTACELHGMDPRETLRRIAAAKAEAKELGVELAFAPESSINTNVGV